MVAQLKTLLSVLAGTHGLDAGDLILAKPCLFDLPVDALEAFFV